MSSWDTKPLYQFTIYPLYNIWTGENEGKTPTRKREGCISVQQWIELNANASTQITDWYSDNTDVPVVRMCDICHLAG